ncbi:hypothetical protein [Aestuariimicrobium ganziense]|uniref:hypothetical protein n=1 Tax=Aestuariimicrobium ganziense TaxID=2773677 RepID=UPI0019450A47|nr:hypothetical protein [Aestuariimicrobium ganziense]
MTGFFEIFNPGQRHAREQMDFDKIAVVPTKRGGRGPLQIDLENGTVTLPNRHSHLSQEAVKSTRATSEDDQTPDAEVDDSEA